MPAALGIPPATVAAHPLWQRDRSHRPNRKFHALCQVAVQRGKLPTRLRWISIRNHCDFIIRCPHLLLNYFFVHASSAPGVSGA